MEATGTTNLNGRNGNKTVVIEKPMVANTSDLEARIADAAPTSSELVLAPEADKGEQEKVVAPKKGKKPLKLILAGLGVGAIAGGGFGYRYWQFASTHQETDNATIAGHIHQVSTKIPGTVSEVLVNDNELVEQGQLLIKLDERDYQNKVALSQAALQAAQRQAQAAEANIALASQTTTAKTTQAQGDVSGSIAAISTAQAAVEVAKAGIPAAQADVRQAEAGIPAAQAQVAQADANLQKAKADYNRYSALFQQGAIARQQLDTARASLDVATAQKSAAEQGV